MNYFGCCKQSDVTANGDDNALCVALREWVGETFSGTVDSCKGEVTERRETGDGSEKPEGNNGGKDCRNEMCSGGENAKLKFILATVTVVLFGILSC